MRLEAVMLRKGSFFPKNTVEQLDMTSNDMNLDTDFTLLTKINLKWLTELNVKCKINKTFGR